MAQRLRTLPDLPEVLSSIPSNHMVAHKQILLSLLACRKNTVYIKNNNYRGDFPSLELSFAGCCRLHTVLTEAQEGAPHHLWLFLGGKTEKAGIMEQLLRALVHRFVSACEY